MIQTQYEINGEWSSSAFGQQFMLDLSSDSGVPLYSIGKAHLGSEIYGMKFGTGDMTLIITGGVHRAEDASREMVMMKTRDMAYNYNGKYNDFFERYTIYAIPTVNPETTTRNNAQRLNINRDAYDLETTEMPLLMKFVNEKNPHIYIDFHERSGTADMKLEFIDPSNLDSNSEASIKKSSAEMELYIRDILETKGYATSIYPQGIIGPGMTVAAAALMGAITSTPETHIEIPWENRVSGQKETFDSLISWCMNNQVLIRNTKIGFQNNFIKPRDNFVLLNGDNEYYLPATKKTIKVPNGYIIDENEDFSKWVETYGIEIDENDFVPIEQKAGRLLPHLLDPESDKAVVSAVRVEPPEPEYRTDGRYAVVKYDDWEEVFIQNYL